MAAGLAAAALFPYAVAWGQHGQARHLAQFVYALAGDLCEKRRLGGGVAKEARFGGVARRPGPDRGGGVPAGVPGRPRYLSCSRGLMRTSLTLTCGGASSA